MSNIKSTFLNGVISLNKHIWIDAERFEFASDMDASDFWAKLCSTTHVATIDGSEGSGLKGLVSKQGSKLGFDVVQSDLLSLSEQTYSGVFSDVFAIRVPCDMHAKMIKVGSQEMAPPPGAAIELATVSDITLDGMYLANARYQDFILRVTAPDLLGGDVAELIDARKKDGRAACFKVDERLYGAIRSELDPEDTCPMRALLLESYALELIVSCLRKSTPDSPLWNSNVKARDKKKMQQVYDRICDQPQAAHTLADLAQDAGVSVTLLKTKFQAVFGKTVFSALRDVRLDLARDGLKREGWTVSQAAFFVGYKHQSSFSKAFHRRFGVWPSEVV